MISPWTAIRFLHVVSAILWVGGQLTLALIVRPVSGDELDSETRTRLITAMGRRYGRIASVGLIPVLLATGLALVYRHGVEFGGLNLSTYATTLTVKIVLALASFGLALAHGIIAMRSSGTSVRTVAIAGTTVSVLVVLAAVMLVG